MTAENWDVSSLRIQNGPHQILILDDDPCVLSTLRRALRGEPYEVLTSDDPDEAMELVERRKIDVVMVDQYMPGIFGTEFLEEVRRRRPNCARVILTGHPDWLPMQEGLEGHVQYLVTKPWSTRDLKETLRELLKAVAIP